MGLKRRFDRWRLHFEEVRPDTSWFRAALYGAMATRATKTPLYLTFRGRPLYVRPHTPDLKVAQISLAGEMDVAIEAATPLRYNFIIDAGAYIGTTAIAFAEAFPEATIVALEPSRDNFAVLLRNTRRHPNIRVVNRALGGAEGTAALYDPGENEWGYSTVGGRTNTPSLHQVDVTTVPTLLKQFGRAGADILKLDIEGSEIDVLNASASWLDSIRVVVAETHDWLVPGCQDAFDRATAGRRTMQCDGEKMLSVR